MSNPPVALPNDLATALRYLADPEFQRLKAAVEAEIARRKRGSSTAERNGASASLSSSPETAQIAEIPEGKANLIRASFAAGLKAPTIARTFGVSVSLVNRVIRSSTTK